MEGKLRSLAERPCTIGQHHFRRWSATPISVFHIVEGAELQDQCQLSRVRDFVLFFLSRTTLADYQAFRRDGRYAPNHPVGEPTFRLKGEEIVSFLTSPYVNRNRVFLNLQ